MKLAPIELIRFKTHKTNCLVWFRSSCSGTIIPNKKNITLITGNNQFVRGKISTRPECGDYTVPANREYLNFVVEQSKPAIARYNLPQTSAQEIGWFTKPDPTATAGLTRDPGSTTNFDPVNTIPEFRKNPQVNHQKVDSDILRYKDFYWRYHPVQPAKFHPKSQ